AIRSSSDEGLGEDGRRAQGSTRKNHRAHDDLVLRLRPQEGERSTRPSDGARSRPEATWLAACTEPGQFPDGPLQPPGEPPSSARACVEVLRDDPACNDKSVP